MRENFRDELNKGDNLTIKCLTTWAHNSQQLTRTGQTAYIVQNEFLVHLYTDISEHQLHTDCNRSLTPSDLLIHYHEAQIWTKTSKHPKRNFKENHNY